MAKILKKGVRGAAKAYVTRSAAVKKLQCTLADFRRLCILKGIFPREPRHKKRANKGSTAPTSFYYAKDIAYLAHEPVLKKLREHKAFAKKLSRALGRGEWSSAKSLEENKPVYRLDHIIKERYPSFIDALRDIDDALSLITLFASLPSNPRLPPSLIESCTRLSSEWQLYVMHTRSLRKVFLSIKGVYYQAEVMGQTITWLVPYMFTQSVPADVDVRVMLTFLELYQTLLGFVLFKLYTDVELLYPPPLDISRDEEAAGVGAYNLKGAAPTSVVDHGPKPVDVDGNIVKGRDVRKTIKELAAITLPSQEAIASSILLPQATAETTAEDEFVPQPSSSEIAVLPTLHSIAELPSSIKTSLFAPYTFFLALGSPRHLLEFTIRSFGGHVGWPASMGSGSPIDETDERITHVIIDRPIPAVPAPFTVSEELRRRRKYVQPQWVVDSINAQNVLAEGPYTQGQTLPPHLSPFGDEAHAYVPETVDPDPTDLQNDVRGEEEEEEEEEEEDEEEQVEEMEGDSNGDANEDMANAPSTVDAAIKAAAMDPTDQALLRAAELEAERAGRNTTEFESTLRKAVKKADKGRLPDPPAVDPSREAEMNKMLMSNKKRKLYERMKFGERKKTAERELLESKRAALRKERAKELRKAVRSGLVVKSA